MSDIMKPLDFCLFDFATVKTSEKTCQMARAEGTLRQGDIRLECVDSGVSTDIYLTADTSAVEWVRLRWNQPLPKQVKILGDAWERGYGDLEWRGISANRILPWYFLACAQERQYGFGVRTQPSALCYWQVDTRGITLVLDVRSGGEGVILNGRRLKAAELVCMEAPGTDAFHFAQDFCRLMCPNPIFPDVPVYGSNNWYYAYGDSCEAEILNDTDYVLELTKGAENPPFMVIDDCWQEHHRLDEYNGGPWRCGNSKFPDMAGLAQKLVQKGVHPGIWVRLLLNEDASIPDEWRISYNGCLDPSHPDALEYIKEDVRRICGWGYKLIKHDFSTFDLFGRWGFEMNPFVTHGGWHFHDRSLTSAEVVKTLYQAIYDACSPSNTIIIGCNTIGHLGAGLMHANRTGDDTSGRNWERTRRMGINTLAFRLPQHGTFYDVDADCVGIAGNIPWNLNRQWADLIAESGTPLFVSAKPGLLTPAEMEELRAILVKASAQSCHKIPMDWTETDCPEVWEDADGQIIYNWYDPAGTTLESNDSLFHITIPLQ
ncbi:MAG: alpha-galactosidase [Eubacterium sp.]|nr:alpha-galactosidase [Eubacterium sp.]